LSRLTDLSVRLLLRKLIQMTSFYEEFRTLTFKWVLEEVTNILVDPNTALRGFIPWCLLCFWRTLISLACKNLKSLINHIFGKHNRYAGRHISCVCKIQTYGMYWYFCRNKNFYSSKNITKRLQFSCTTHTSSFLFQFCCPKCKTIVLLKTQLICRADLLCTIAQ
jgi:hypothetical protein